MSTMGRASSMSSKGFLPLQCGLSPQPIRSGAVTVNAGPRARVNVCHCCPVAPEQCNAMTTGPELGRAAACGMIFNMIAISVRPWEPAVGRSLDDEGRFERHRPGDIVEIGRGRHYRLVDRGELLLGAAALDADAVTQRLVADRYRRIDAEEAAQIDVTVGLDLEP